MSNAEILSEKIVGYCPLGGACPEKTKRFREYARFLEKLAKERSSLLFSNGGKEPDWCPGNCGDKRRQDCNIKVCEKEGLNPMQWLDEKGLPKMTREIWMAQQRKNNVR